MNIIKNKPIDKKNYNYLILIIVFSCTSLILFILMMTRIFGALEISSKYIIDTVIFYDKDFILNSLYSLGDKGRFHYLLYHLVDYLFIVNFYTLLFLLITVLLGKNNLKFMSKGIAVIPLYAGAFDLMENFIIDISLINYPYSNDFLISICSAVTVLKFGLVLLSLIVILVTIAFNLYSLVYSKKYSLLITDTK